MRPDADKTWFNITISGGPRFDVYSLSGSEGINTLFSYQVGLVNKNPNIPLPDLVGKDACLTIKDLENSQRVVHGVVREMNLVQTGNKLHHYSCIIVPRLWFLTETSDHRIYQDKTVVDIIKELLEEQGFSGSAYSFDRCTPPPPREYCVQYRESDYYFISRLCEEEGIFFYFEHTKAQHTLCFANVEGTSLPMVQGNPAFRFEKGSGTTGEKGVVSSVELHHKTGSNKSTYREWNFTQAKLNLEVEKEEADPIKAPPMPIGDSDTFQFPHRYEDPGEGERYADIQVKRQIASNCWIDATSDACRFVPGFQFSIWGHLHKDINRPWVVYSLHLTGEQPGVLGDEAPGGVFFSRRY